MLGYLLHRHLRKINGCVEGKNHHHFLVILDRLDYHMVVLKPINNNSEENYSPQNHHDYPQNPYTLTTDSKPNQNIHNQVPNPKQIQDLKQK